jgi:NAD-dependent deacetylase
MVVRGRLWFDAVVNPLDRGPLHRALDGWVGAGRGPVLVLTGAGISAESGIPTFRGHDGYWTVGSNNYRPMDFATQAAFRRMPEEVWSFYLARIARHKDAEPNPGHLALSRLENALGARFLLVTQNVDGLHARAGNSPERTYRIHGDLGEVRCAAGCGLGLRPLPAVLLERRDETEAFDETVRAALTCPSCGDWLRPHVLWFDEYYDEEWFRFDSTLRAAERAELLLVIGTSGATNLPNLVVETVSRRGQAILVVGPEDSPFSEVAEAAEHGAFLRGSAGEWVPPIVDAIVEREARA